MTTNNIDHELDETELGQVVGGDTALQHEAVHADLPNNGIQFGGGRYAGRDNCNSDRVTRHPEGPKSAGP